MIKCSNCNGLSPYDAKFCIDCGKLIPDGTIAYTGTTSRLADEVPSKPYIPYGGFMEYGRTHFQFGLVTGAPNIQPQEQLYFIYKADLGGILKDEATYVRQTDKGYDIYYKGRKIVFID